MGELIFYTPNRCDRLLRPPADHAKSAERRCLRRPNSSMIDADGDEHLAREPVRGSLGRGHDHRRKALRRLVELTYDALNRMLTRKNGANETTTLSYDDNLADGVGMDAQGSRTSGLALGTNVAGGGIPPQETNHPSTSSWPTPLSLPHNLINTLSRKSGKLQLVCPPENRTPLIQSEASHAQSKKEQRRK